MEIKLNFLPVFFSSTQLYKKQINCTKYAHINKHKIFFMQSKSLKKQEGAD